MAMSGSKEAQLAGDVLYCSWYIFKAFDWSRTSGGLGPPVFEGQSNEVPRMIVDFVVFSGLIGA